MSKNLSVAEKLKTKYHKCEEVTNFKDMLERSAEIYKTRTAFKLKDKNGKIYSQTYESFKNDVFAFKVAIASAFLFQYSSAFSHYFGSIARTVYYGGWNGAASSCVK